MTDHGDELGGGVREHEGLSQRIGIHGFEPPPEVVEWREAGSHDELDEDGSSQEETEGNEGSVT
jgi:hypothetical protein